MKPSLTIEEELEEKLRFGDKWTEPKDCHNCSHYHLTAISCLRGSCVPKRNFKCKDNSIRIIK